MGRLSTPSIARALRVPPEALPLALVSVHAALAVGARWTASFTGWDADALRAVVEGGGFTVELIASGRGRLQVDAVRARTLPDYVGPGLRLVVVGLNPSLYAADAGVGFARPGNRFWPAALEAGLVTRDRDPWHTVRVDRVGMTDLVKRASVGAAELTRDEYRTGLERVEHLASWLRPGAVCFLGLAGWRAAADRKAVAGEQPRTLGGVPVYVMPNPSGLNAHDTVASLADHLRAAMTLADSSGRD
ncbi:MAG: mismatch-specific DNA-glycosylase [Acidimicrobiia bacterium]